MNQIDISRIKIGVQFSKPVFFDDGICMFLGAYKSAKAFHMSALKRWSVPYLLSDGEQLTEEQILMNMEKDEEEFEELEELEPLDED